MSPKKVNILGALFCFIGLLIPPIGITVTNFFLLAGLLGNVYFLVNPPN